MKKLYIVMCENDPISAFKTREKAEIIAKYLYENRGFPEKINYWHVEEVTFYEE